MLMRLASKMVAAQSPCGQLPKCGPGLNTIAVHRGLNGIRMVYASNMEIFGEGEPAEYLYEVVRGSVRSCKMFGDGRRQITSFHMAGKCLGSNRTRSTTSRLRRLPTQSSSRLSAVPSWDLRLATSISPISSGP